MEKEGGQGEEIKRKVVRAGFRQRCTAPLRLRGTERWECQSGLYAFFIDFHHLGTECREIATIGMTSRGRPGMLGDPNMQSVWASIPICLGSADD